MSKIIRVKFKKEGDMIYISHLDLQRLLQRAFRRAEITLSHSQGFNPHPKMSYGNALALGTESQGEYVDIEIEEDDLSVEEFLNKVSIQLPDGIDFIKAKEIDRQTPSLSSVIDYGEYLFNIDLKRPMTKEFVKRKVIDFMNNKEIIITKKNKKGKMVEVDIRPMIRTFDVLNLEDEHITLTATIATGSKTNLNTNILIPKILEMFELDIEKRFICIRRWGISDSYVSSRGEVVKKIVIESLIGSQKTAVLEDERLTELFVEDNLNKKTVSNIYRGIVKKVIPGIEACFVDIGFKKLAYLQLKKGRTKGAKLNTEISISGRYIVYIPSNDRTTISNKITDEKERFRLKKITKAVNKENLGLIIRTEAQGCTHDEIKKDIEELKLKYENILKEYKLGIGPKLLYKSLDFATKYVKDNVNDDIESIITNSYDKYSELKSILRGIDKTYVDKLCLEENRDVFDLYRIESKIEKLLNKKVWLKSGGYLIIEKTEALTVIDVNTGKFIGTGKLDETVYKTNLEAAKEIVRQLRIRDIAGIIIIDFIDMHKKKHQKEILHILEEEFNKDKRKAEVLGMTKLGLVEVARRREKESIDKYYLMSCPCCDGEQTIKSVHYILDSIEKEIMRISEHTVYKNIMVEFNDFIFEQIKEYYMDIIDKIGEKYNIKISLNANSTLKHNKTNVIFDKIVDNKM